MLRSIFFSTGLFVTLWGVTFLFVDRVVLKPSKDTANQARVAQQNNQRPQGFRGMFNPQTQTQTGNRPTAAQPQPRVVDPPDWAAFSLMSIGSVTMLFAAALPRRAGD